MRTYREEELIDGIRDHDSEILKYVYTTFFPVIENYIFHNNGSHEQAEDVFQEAMIIIYVFDGFEGNKDFNAVVSEWQLPSICLSDIHRWESRAVCSRGGNSVF